MPESKSSRRPGRQSTFDKRNIKIAFKLSLLGATDKEIGEAFEVSEVTINNWKKAHPEFGLALKRGKIEADAEVTNRLYKRALGYSHKEDKVFNHNGTPMIVPTRRHYPPDVTACIFWLKNRQSAKWRDRPIESDGDDTATPEKVVLKEMNASRADAKS